MKTTKNKKKGFTLVELIVVLVILAVLAALLIPALTSYIEKAHEKSYILQCRSIVQASQTLASEDYGKSAFDGDTFLTSDKKNKIFTLADIEQTNDRDIRTITFGSSTNPAIQTLIYRPLSGTTVIYERGGNPEYRISKDVGAVSYNTQWQPVIAAIDGTQMRTGVMRETVKALNGGTFPPLIASESQLLLGGDGITGIDQATLNSLTWKPTSLKTVDDKFIMTATTSENSILANLVYYDGHYYGCVNKTYNGVIKMDNMPVTDSMSITDLTSAETLDYYKDHADEVTAKTWVKLN